MTIIVGNAVTGERKVLDQRFTVVVAVGSEELKKHAEMGFEVQVPASSQEEAEQKVGAAFNRWLKERTE